MKEQISRTKLNIASKKKDGKIKIAKCESELMAAAYIKRDGRKV